MNVTERWLYFLMEGQQVERFHSRPLLKPITDAHHQHGVAMFCYMLSDGGCPSANLIMAALVHDQAEQAASDMSAPAKRALSMRAALKTYEESFLQIHALTFELTESEQYILNMADQFEGMLECIRERFYGNRFVNLMYWKWYTWSQEAELTHMAVILRDALHKMWLWADSGEAPIYDVYTEVSHGKTEN